jgi:hypothetical protein
VPFKRKKGCDTTPEQKRLNRLLAALRSAVEHPFRVLKRQFGYTKVRYRGLFKNEQHVFSQFTLVNLYLARHAIAPGAPAPGAESFRCTENEPRTLLKSGRSRPVAEAVTAQPPAPQALSGEVHRSA